MKKTILFLMLLMVFFADAQDLKKILGKAFKSADSSDFYFAKAKKLIKTDADEAEFYFCKNARNNDYGRLDSAVFYGKIAADKLLKTGNWNYLCYVYNNLGKTYNKQGQYDKAIAVLLKGLAVAEKQNLEYWTFNFNVLIGLNYHDFESFEKGIYYCHQGEKIAKKSTTDRDSKLKFAYNTLAINFDDWNKPDSALYYHFKNLKLFKGKDTLLLGTTLNNIGNTYSKKQNFKEAQKWFKRSLAISNINLKNKPKDAVYFYEYATIYNNLAALAYKTDDFESAKVLFEKSKFYATNSKDAEKLRDYYREFYLFNKKNKNLEKTIEAQESYITLRDSVFQTERANLLSTLEAKYQNEKKEKLLLIAKAKEVENRLVIKRKQNFIYLSIILFIGFFVIGLLVYRQQKLKNRQQKQQFELTSAIEKIESQNKLQEQRLSISRDLHDNIGSQLTFIISSVDNIKYAFDIQNPQLDYKLNAISGFTKDTIVELRDTIWAMNSEEISFQDLESRIHNFIEKAKNVSQNISFSFAIDQGLMQTKLSSVQGMNVYRTIQEAINNSLKYAQANLISVNIKPFENRIKISIQDNGKGFDLLTVERGNGINNMQKRIEEIGGAFEINSNNEGTLIFLVV